MEFSSQLTHPLPLSLCLVSCFFHSLRDSVQRHYYYARQTSALAASLSRSFVSLTAVPSHLVRQARPKKNIGCSIYWVQVFSNVAKHCVIPQWPLWRGERRVRTGCLVPLRGRGHMRSCKSLDRDASYHAQLIRSWRGFCIHTLHGAHSYFLQWRGGVWGGRMGGGEWWIRSTSLRGCVLIAGCRFLSCCRRVAVPYLHDSRRRGA